MKPVNKAAEKLAMLACVKVLQDGKPAGTPDENYQRTVTALNDLTKKLHIRTEMLDEAKALIKTWCTPVLH